MVTRAFSGSTTLAELASGAPVELGGGSEGALGLQRATGGLRSLGTSELSVSFETDVSRSQLVLRSRHARGR